MPAETVYVPAPVPPEKAANQLGVPRHEIDQLLADGRLQRHGDGVSAASILQVLREQRGKR